MIIKCKMCGGDIRFNPGDTNGQCDHCGCTTTFPKLPDEQRTNLFNRANHFRRQCEFDKAMAAYEHILEEDETDAEAHWGIVLSRFGIEYVEDPVTHERIPTCHRAQVISILSDEDYRDALKYAPDTSSREIYEKEAKRIAEIQKGILAISSREKPYDVFICYKETDDHGSRTRDSALAQEIYYQLTNEGCKVFFSRITLEDKLGREYEPYIFAALNSAKVMLVVGTKPENFSAVWVKNEWSRFLAIMKNDRKRVLIPCYRDMDPYDLPEELSSLQSQDMSKIGFMQDLIHGVKKVLGTEKQSVPNVTVQAAGPGVESLHKRAVLFLEDSDWDAAAEYFDRILDIDPEYAPAYIGKVQVKKKVRREADLARSREPIAEDADFRKAVRFADEKQKAVYEGYSRAILERIALERKEAAYREAAALEGRAAVEAEFLAAAVKFDSAGDIRDAKERAANCRAKAAAAKAEAEKAAAVYKAQMERERKERAKQEEEKRAAEEQRQKEEAERRRKEEALRADKRKRTLKICSVLAAAVLLIAGGYLVYEKVIRPKSQYDRAQALLNDGRYDEAYSAFEAMGGYGDSAEKLSEIHYRKAADCLAGKDFAEARSCYVLAGNYSDAARQVRNIDDYLSAQADGENGDLIAAGEKFRQLGDFSDAAERFESIASALYDRAKAALENKNYQDAFVLLTGLGDYSDCPALMADVDGKYNLALQHWKDGEKLPAEEELQALAGWRDAGDQLSALRLEIADDAYANGDYDLALSYYGMLRETDEIRSKIEAAQSGKYYLEGKAALESGDKANAYINFLAAGSHADAADQAEKLARYIEANQLAARGKYEEAREIWLGLGGFLDAPQKLAAANDAIYTAAKAAMENGSLQEAYDAFRLISGYSDSAEIVAKIDHDYQAALDHLEKGERFEAESILLNLRGWGDVDAVLNGLWEEIADHAAGEKDYALAVTYYGKIPDRPEAVEEKLNAAVQGKNYTEGMAFLNAGDLDAATERFTAAGDFGDAAEQIGKITSYRQAEAFMEEGEYREAREIWLTLGGFLDAPEKLAACNDAIYTAAKASMENGSLQEAYDAFRLISGYSDSAEIVDKIDSDYRTALDHLEKGERFEAESLLLNLRGWGDADAVLNGLWEEIADHAAGEKDYALAVTYYGKIPDRSEADEEKLNTAVQGKNYTEGMAFLNAGDLDAATERFTAAGDFGDAAGQIGKIAAYRQAEAFAEEGKYREAREVYLQLGDYLGSAEKLEACSAALYGEAAERKADGDYAKANELFILISGYSDSAEIASRFAADYRAADALLEGGSYDEAYAAFTALKNYEDSAEKAQESLYRKAEALRAAGAFDEAAAVYSGLGDYRDSADKIHISLYSKAEAQTANGQFDEAIATFEGISGYGDSADRAKSLRYDRAKRLWTGGDLEAARQEYEALGDYADSAALLVQVLTETADKAVDEKDYAAALSVYRELEQTDEIREREYRLAQRCYDEGHFAEAVSAYEILGRYEMSLSRLPVARYAWADQLFNAGEYRQAAEQFALLGDMTDSAARANESLYRLASETLAAGNYAGAKELFTGISGYGDADTLAKECDYRIAAELLAEGKNKEAEALFRSLGQYSDSKTRVEECVYNQAEALFAAGQYHDANAMYASIDYLDSKEKAMLSAYREAEALCGGGRYAEAEDIFLSLKDYRDSPDRAKDCRLQQGIAFMDAGDYRGALGFFETVEYGNSAGLAAKCHYELGRMAHMAGRADEAVAEYAYAVSLPEACGALLSAAMDYTVINEPEKAIQALWLIRDREEARDELSGLAAAAARNGKADLALLAWSALEEQPEAGPAELIEGTSGDSFIAAVGQCTLLADSLGFREYALYHFAAMALDAGQYDLAVRVFSGLEGYRDAADRVFAARYAQGEAKRAEADWDGAVEAFTEAGAYGDAAVQISETRYQEASAKERAGDREGAYDIFIRLTNYKDAFERACKPYYDLGLEKKEAGEWDAAVEAFRKAGSYSDAVTQVRAVRYSEGEARLAAKDWDGAAEAFRKAGTYSDAVTRVKAVRYSEGEARLAAKDWDGAAAAFTEAGAYGDAAAQVTETRYLQAKDAAEKGDYAGAAAILIGLGDYRDAGSLLVNDPNLAAAVAAIERDKKYAVGNYVTFGHYPQTREGNDSTPIEWLVLDRKWNRALLLSRYGLDRQLYNIDATNITWEKCRLRTWLNGTFLIEAFTPREQAGIMRSDVDNSGSQGSGQWSTSGGDDTVDRIFLLSCAEANRYLGVTVDNRANRESRVVPTDYALRQGAEIYETDDGSGAGWWWLRSPGPRQSDAALVDYNGALDFSPASYFGGCIRPALWINLDSGIF